MSDPSKLSAIPGKLDISDEHKHAADLYRQINEIKDPTLRVMYHLQLYAMYRLSEIMPLGEYYSE